MDLELIELIKPNHSAAIVVDIQNDFCHSEGALAKAGGDISLTQEKVHNTEKFLNEARQYRVPIIFIKASHNEWNNSPAYLSKRKVVLCMEGTWGEDFFVVRPQEGEPIVVKHRYSAFIGTNLDLILRSKGIKSIILTGGGTHVCVESTARDGFMMDYNVVVLSDCTMAPLEDHNRALDILGRNFATIATSKDILEAWKTSAPLLK